MAPCAALLLRRLVPSLALMSCLSLWAPAASAQEAGVRDVPFLFINQERILVDSKAGQAILASEEERRNRLVAEARAIDAAFEAEERALTEKRKSLPPAEFHQLAEDFDKRVVAARQRQDERSDALAQDLERARRQFFAEVAPILVQFMDGFGAVAIFDENTVLLADQRLNITDEVIAEIDGRAEQKASGAGAPDSDMTEDDQP
jgi:Skp family chaperone for outer membrane proteins